MRMDYEEYVSLLANAKQIHRNRVVCWAADLQVGLSSEGSILDVADLVLGEIEVSEVCEAVHGGKEHSLKFVLIQSQVVNLQETREQIHFR